MSAGRSPAPELPGVVSEPVVTRGRKIVGAVSATLIADQGGFETRSVRSIAVDFEGVIADHHRGHTRRAGGREPWYPRGAIMRNERQISIVATDELTAIAAAMGAPRIAPEWIGANLVIDGVPRLSWLPPRSRLFVDGGAVLVIEGQNAPCRVAGAAIARRYPDQPEFELMFVKAARRLRGLVAWVERPGEITAGAKVEAKLPEQWIYA